MGQRLHKSDAEVRARVDCRLHASWVFIAAAAVPQGGDAAVLYDESKELPMICAMVLIWSYWSITV
jgi:hypothetical protein